MLALGFGEAGSEIIAKNISDGAEINPMLPGAKVIGIFGFCGISGFNEATEVLQEGIMLFVNEISNIVHGDVYKYLGGANKNIGEAFLLVWKFDADSIRTNYLTQELELLPNYQVTQLCEMSMISFLKVQASI